MRGGGPGQEGRGGIPCPLPSRPPTSSHLPTLVWVPSFWKPRPQALGPKPPGSPPLAPIISFRHWLLAPLDFLHAVPPKNIVPVIVTSEDPASRVTSITHWPVLASGVVIVLANYKWPVAPTDFPSPGAHQEIFEKRRLPRLVAPIDFLSPGHPKLGAGRPACWSWHAPANLASCTA